MISGIVMVLVAIWIYQTMMKARKGNVLIWVAGLSLAFFFAVFIAQVFCIEIIDALGGQDIGDNYDRDLTSVGDRRTQENAGGFFINSLCELFPSFAGVVLVGIVRTLVILKEPLTVGNVFSGLKEVLMSIVNSFKTTAR